MFSLALAMRIRSESVAHARPRVVDALDTLDAISQSPSLNGESTLVRAMMVNTLYGFHALWKADIGRIPDADDVALWERFARWCLLHVYQQKVVFDISESCRGAIGATVAGQTRAHLFNFETWRGLGGRRDAWRDFARTVRADMDVLHDALAAGARDIWAVARMLSARENVEAARRVAGWALAADSRAELVDVVRDISWETLTAQPTAESWRRECVQLCELVRQNVSLVGGGDRDLASEMFD